MKQEEIQQQLNFILETDKLKSVERRTRPIGQSRRENSAEHSWQVALTAMLLVEHANQEVDLLRVIKMLLIHDVVEVDVGDVQHSLKDSIPDLHEKELKAAERLFGMLPQEQRDESMALWNEFEARQ